MDFSQDRPARLQPPPIEMSPLNAKSGPQILRHAVAFMATMRSNGRLLQALFRAVLASTLGLAHCGTAGEMMPVQEDIFISGTGGYHTYRIPALAVTREGVLLAFAEGRKNSRSDIGDIDLLLRRSLDGGRSWLPVQLLWDDDANTCGNPTVVVDRRDGTIWLVANHNLGS